jgi:membrane protein
MGKLRKAYGYLKEKYKLLSVKKYTTLAGMLVFFLLTSIVPLAFWLTLIIGRLPINIEGVLQLSVFNSVKSVLLYVQKEAQNATASASVILLATTLYSSTNLFYQMRRSGEIIYEYQRHKKGLRLRIGALILMLIVVCMVMLFLILFALGAFLFSRYLPKGWEIFADYTLLIGLSFALVLLLNIYICPFKARVRRFLPGTVVTVIAWAGAVVGFTVYLKISNMDKLYGALSALIIFFLWLYVLMICFIAGVIFNSEKITLERKELSRKRREQRKKRKKIANISP